MDITSLLGSFLGDSSLEAIGNVTNTNTSDVTNVLKSALPKLLEGASKQAASKTNKEGFEEALATHAKDRISSVTSFLKKVDLEDGAKIVKHLIGGTSATATKEISKESGVSAKNVTSILSAIAPLFMSLLGKEEKNSKATDATELLTSLMGNVNMTKVLKSVLGGSSSTGSTLSKAASLIGGLMKKK